MSDASHEGKANAAEIEFLRAELLTGLTLTKIARARGCAIAAVLTGRGHSSQRVLQVMSKPTL